MRIVLATGGSGGHIFPALKVAQRLQALGHETIFVGALGQALPKIQQQKFCCFNLNSKGVSLSSVSGFVRSSFCMAKALVESFHVLRMVRPDAVCGFGGYGAFPVVCAALILGRPSMIHEQNVIPGRANRILFPWVGKVAVTFEESRKYFHSPKTIRTGCPAQAREVREKKRHLRAELGLQGDKETLLVLGGSQGSHRINLEFLKAIPFLKEDRDFQVIHISGRNDYAALKDQYAECGIGCRVFDFLEDMGKAYQAADMVVSRAGALTVLEIAAFRLPAVLIPYPFAGGHQKENAELLCGAGLAKMVEEKDLSAQGLAEAVRNLLSGPPPDPKEIEQRLKSILIPGADQRLAQEIVALGKTANISLAKGPSA